MTEDISEDESRVCRCTVVPCPSDKSFRRSEDALGEVSYDQVVVVLVAVRVLTEEIGFEISKV